MLNVELIISNVCASGGDDNMRLSGGCKKPNAKTWQGNEKGTMSSMYE